MPKCFLDHIREAMIAEIVAINGYTEHIANSDIEGINSLWRNIMQDEKDHYGMFLKLIHKYDPEEYRLYIKHAHDYIPVLSTHMYRPQYDIQLILNNIRQDIKGELEAVVLYDQIMRSMPYKDAKDVFAFVINAEKEHIEHLTRALMQYDPDQYDDLR
jgi:rubrerythrin